MPNFITSLSSHFWDAFILTLSFTFVNPNLGQNYNFFVLPIAKLGHSVYNQIT